MKLASLPGSGRDGRLVIVKRDLTRFVEAGDIAQSLIAALEKWPEVSPRLEARAEALEAGKVKSFALDPALALAPLPRAPQFLDGSAYVTHVELVRKARGATLPESFWTDPLMYQGVSDRFLGPRAPIQLANEAWGIDLEAEIAVIVDDVPMGIDAGAAREHIRLILILNDVSLRNLIPEELAKGFGFLQSKPASSLSLTAVTPAELGGVWDGGRLHRPLHSHINRRELGHPDAGTDMTFDFPTLIAHAAKTRHLSAGTIIGSGTVANRDHEIVGSSCLAERRMIETLKSGQATTPFLKFGDEIEIVMKDEGGRDIFGAIRQKIQPYRPH